MKIALIVLLTLFIVSSALFVFTIGSPPKLSTQAVSCPPQNGYVDPGCDMVKLVKEQNPTATINTIAFVVLFASGIGSLILSIILLVRKSTKGSKLIH